MQPPRCRNRPVILHHLTFLLSFVTQTLHKPIIVPSEMLAPVSSLDLLRHQSADRFAWDHDPDQRALRQHLTQAPLLQAIKAFVANFVVTCLN